ncbi:MAG: DUF262 domain-containing protein [Kiritimatiellales bacterium]|nr:DUF262 domain-containing protein [Kiritimatiellales bacterium]
MRIDGSTYSIGELHEMLERKDLLVNREYQRGPRLWPTGARSYFIDTILTGFPFPKLYFYEYLDREGRKTKREIVDGQQRISAMMDFRQDKYALTSVSRQFSGMRFSDLAIDVQDSFLTYSVPVDVIRNAEKGEILEMFRRMNAYTLPLNEAEKRHSTYQGAFKWFINETATEWTPFLVEFGVFTNRQVVRMADAELLAEMILALENGIVSSSNKALSDLYKKYDDEFAQENRYRSKLTEFMSFITEHCGELRGSYLMKPYVVHSLFCAAMHNKYGVPGVEEKIGLAPIQAIVGNTEQARLSLQALALAHEGKDLEGEFGEYVWGCTGGTNREPRRVARVKHLCLALRGELMKG